MKQDVINKFYQAKQAGVQAAEDAAASDFYDDAYADGAASVPVGGGSGISQADLDAKVEEMRVAMQSNLDQLKLDLDGDEKALRSHEAAEASLHAKLDQLKVIIEAE